MIMKLDIMIDMLRKKKDKFTIVTVHKNVENRTKSSYDFNKSIKGLKYLYKHFDYIKVIEKQQL